MILEPAEIDFSLVGPVREESIELALLAAMLEADFREAAQAYNGAQTEYASRVLFRAAFAYVEGILFRLRFVILAYASAGRTQLRPEEMLVLRDETPSLDKSGKIETRLAFAQTRPFLKYALRTYGYVLGAEQAVDIGDAGYAALDSSVLVRNRITHPKHRTHLHVTMTEIDDLQKGMQWFMRTLNTLFGVQAEQNSRET